MRILMLAQFYPPTMGGEEQHVRTLSHALVRRGHDVAVATLWQAGLPELELDAGVRVHRIRSTTQRAAWLFKERGRPHAPPFPDPEGMLALERLVREERPEIVHAHNWLVHSFLPLKEQSRARLVVTLHDYSLVCPKKRLMYRGAPCSGPRLGKCLSCALEHYGPAKGTTTVAGNWIMGAWERRAVDLFIAVSQATANGNGLAQSRVPYRVIPNFILDEAVTGATGGSVEPPVLDGEEYFLFVGDIVPDKGVDVLLRAYAGLEGAPPLVLIGRRSNLSPRELPRGARLVDSLPHSQVMRAWDRSLVGLQPSIVPETFGLAALEAMARGRPVIASRIGGLSDVVADGETGLLVPPGDATALGAAMERLMRDPALRLGMGRAARLRAAEYRESRVVPHIEQAYRDLLIQRK